ncbi:MAG TPA: dihydropteroate synthase [Candidatus Pullilachnospira intestinigallinarum]|nr:dihydropteroate synthase [Candidatus Pullilachnospira intestinigallinarum]
MMIGNRQMDLKNHCHVMGILNVTPDSFSDGGKYNRMDAALLHAEQMVREGADVIDVGGESTRPGYQQVSIQEEIGRVAPVIEKIKERLDVPVSIDTYKAPVAEAALKAGADMVNDIWGFRADPQMAEITARYHAACCLMHNRQEAVYKNFWTDFLDDMKICVELAREAGVEEDRILLDPGVGFGKTYEQNLAVINHLDRMEELGFPILLGTSRKSVIGRTLDLPSDQRVEGTLATTALGIIRGAAFVRVHDVRENCRLIRMMEALLAAD